LLTGKHIYGELELDVIELLKTYNTVPHHFPKNEEKDNCRIRINNNPDLVHILKKIGYLNLICGNHPEYSYILEKGKCIIFVTQHIEAHHYFG
jgi:hypothetical protein